MATPARENANDTSEGLHATEAAFRKMSVHTDFTGLFREAKDATNVEKSMTILQDFQTYPKAVMLSMMVSTAIIMEGYDIVLLANFYAFPSFCARYGEPTDNPKRPYEIPAPWQAGLSNGAQVGEILSLFINDIVSERYRYKKTMLVSLVAVTEFIFITFYCEEFD